MRLDIDPEENDIIEKYGHIIEKMRYMGYTDKEVRDKIHYERLDDFEKKYLNKVFGLNPRKRKENQ